MHLRKKISSGDIKEAMDNLPVGLCFFDKNGFVILCNRKMHQLVLTITGCDLQSTKDMDRIFAGDVLYPMENDLYHLENNTVWQFRRSKITAPSGNVYTQVIASDVTTLYYRRKDLERENHRLLADRQRLLALSENIAQVNREEELLNLKMKVHDDFGRSLIATRRHLQQNLPLNTLDLSLWKQTIHFMQSDSSRILQPDQFSSLKQIAAGIGIQLLLTGELPSDEKTAYLMITAMRECCTNAVRHASATEVYAYAFTQNETEVLTITNNGTPPSAAIIEGGGLSSLRTKIEHAGGQMELHWYPKFKLVICFNR